MFGCYFSLKGCAAEIVQAGRQEVFIFHTLSPLVVPMFAGLFFTSYWGAPVGNHGGQTAALLPETTEIYQ